MYKILVVDDEANIRKLIAKYASFEGYQVEEASDGEQAVGLCRSGSFDLIVMDIMMPGMDGLTACAKIKEFSDVPIIMLSARGEEYDKIYGFRMGIDDYVVKPFSPKELMLRIQAVLKRCEAARVSVEEDAAREQYWSEHAQEKAALEQEREALTRQADQLEADLAADPVYEERKRKQEAIDDLSRQKQGLGLFKGKEKKAI